VRLTISLDLSDFIERLPPGTLFHVIGRKRLPGGGVHLNREHDAVGHVAVMGQRQYTAAGVLLVLLHPFPEIFRVKTFSGSAWQHAGGTLTTVAVEHVSMQVVAVLGGGPLIAEDRGKPAGIIVFLCCFDVRIPYGLNEIFILERLGNFPLGKRVDHLHSGLKGFVTALGKGVVPLAHCRILQQFRVAGENFHHGPHAVRVVCDHQKVERLAKLYRFTVRRDNFLTPGELKGFLWPKGHPKATGIQRVPCVNVGVAPIHPRGKFSPGIR